MAELADNPNLPESSFAESPLRSLEKVYGLGLPCIDVIDESYPEKSDFMCDHRAKCTKSMKKDAFLEHVLEHDDCQLSGKGLLLENIPAGCRVRLNIFYYQIQAFLRKTLL